MKPYKISDKSLIVLALWTFAGTALAQTPVGDDSSELPSFHQQSVHRFDDALMLNRARAGMTNVNGHRIILLDSAQLGLDPRTSMVYPTNSPTFLRRDREPLRDLTVITLLPSNFRHIRAQAGWPEAVHLNAVVFTNLSEYSVATNRPPPLYYRDYVPIGEVFIERRGGPSINVRQIVTTGQP